MTTNIIDELKEMLLLEEEECNLASVDFCKRLISKHQKMVTEIVECPDRLKYSYALDQDIYNKIITEHHLTSDLERIKEVGGHLEIGKGTLGDISVDILADYPSVSAGVTISISFNVGYKGTTITSVAPAIIPGEAVSVEEYVSLLMIMLLTSASVQ